MVVCFPLESVFIGEEKDNVKIPHNKSIISMFLVLINFYGVTGLQLINLKVIGRLGDTISFYLY
jgi:hypothetical protein